MMSLVRPYFAAVLLLFLLVAGGCLSAASDKEPVIRPATFSPDGQYLVFHVDHADPKKGRIIYRILKDGTELTQLTPSEEDCFNPSYSPDGSKIVYAKTPSGKFGEQADLYMMNSDGSNQTPLTSGPALDTFPTFSPDGQRIYFVRARWFGHHSPLVSSQWHDRDLYAVNVDGSNLQAITDGWYYEISKPSISPDGKEILVRAISPSPLTDEEVSASIRKERKEDQDSLWLIPIEHSAEMKPVRPNLMKYSAKQSEKPLASEPLTYDDLYHPRFSPDGESVIFVWGGTIKATSVTKSTGWIWKPKIQKS